jgi:hypothetical protein
VSRLVIFDSFLANDVDEDFYRVRTSQWKTYNEPVENIKEEFIEVRCYWPFELGMTYNYHVQSVLNDKVRVLEMLKFYWRSLSIL